jgi:hypothetical protein
MSEKTNEKQVSGAVDSEVETTADAKETKGAESDPKETKTVQVEFFSDGKAEISYFLGSKPVGDPVTFDEVPKRLRFFLEKFPSS